MQWPPLRRLVLDCWRLLFPTAITQAHPAEPLPPAHSGEGLENEHSGWEAPWIDLGGEG
jgi:hypothetical protein